MDNGNKNEAGNGGSPATEAQVQLALQLYRECNYARTYAEKELRALSKTDISTHIAKLKDWKTAQQAEALQNAKVAGFDKITFAMLWKLLWTEDDVRYYKHRCMELGTETAFGEQYDFYKRVEAAVKKHVLEGGN